MRSRLIPALAAGLLALALLPWAPSAADRELPGPALPPQASPTARAHAEDVLARASSLVDERSPAAADGHDATMVLTQLLRVRDDLPPAQQRRADALLARPTRPGGDGFADYTTTEERPHCGVVICIHYVATTPDAPEMTDGDGDGVPDSVEQALATAEQVHHTYVAAGYRPPDPDRGRGGDDRVDIYLADLGIGFYGYCTSDQRRSLTHVWAYCVIDDDFARDQFPRHTPLENQQVTLAHEYFHAVQFAYDYMEDLWFLEATATWAEDEVYDHIDDNRQYLRAGQLRRPGVPLDSWSAGTSHHYGNWVFFRYLTERWPEQTGSLPRLVREMVEKTSARARAADMYSTQAVQSVLARRGTSFSRAYGDFAVANRRADASYEEGATYPVARPRTWTLGQGNRRTGGRAVRLDHLSHAPFRFDTGRGLAGRAWRIRITVDPPAARTAPIARVAVYEKSGDVSRSTIRLRKRGASSRTLPFSSRRVAHVELVLGNASRRARCWRGTTWACQGAPKDDNEVTRFGASIVRR